MKPFRVVLLVLPALLCVSSVAGAQIAPSMAIGGDLPTEEEKKAAREREEAAKAALARIPAQQKLTNDPWAGARDVTPAPAQPARQLVPQKKSAAKK
jgi:hypothetical protein